MKKVLSLAFITAVFLFGCSADGFFDPGPPPEITYWNRVCKVGDKCLENPLTKAECEAPAVGGTLVTWSDCPKD